MPQGWDLGVLEVQNFSVGFCNGAPLTAHSSLQFNLVIFTTKVNRFKIFCVGNSSYSFMPIPLKIYRYLGNGLKMCISFGNNPQFNFCNFFCKLILGHGLKMCISFGNNPQIIFVTFFTS